METNIRTKNIMASSLLPKYCTKNHFIVTQPKPGDSWSWKSILQGRDVCLKGLDIQVCQSKAKGGLGIRKIEVMNNELLGKQSWRLILEPKISWQLVSFLYTVTRIISLSLNPSMGRKPIMCHCRHNQKT